MLNKKQAFKNCQKVCEEGSVCAGECFMMGFEAALAEAKKAVEGCKIHRHLGGFNDEGPNKPCLSYSEVLAALEGKE